MPQNNDQTLEQRSQAGESFICGNCEKLIYYASFTGWVHYPTGAKACSRRITETQRRGLDRQGLVPPPLPDEILASLWECPLSACNVDMQSLYGSSGREMTLLDVESFVRAWNLGAIWMFHNADNRGDAAKPKEIASELVLEETGVVQIPQPEPPPQDKRLTTFTQAIIQEIYRSLVLLGAEFDLLGTIGSWGDSLSDEDVLSGLRAWNEATLREFKGRIEHYEISSRPRVDNPLAEGR